LKTFQSKSIATTVYLCIATHNIPRAEAKRVIKSQSSIDAAEQQYLLEYYSLVREGKTNYIATTAFHDVTGEHPTEPDDFFSMYETEFRPKKAAKRSHK
jgi:hypothetical protein